mmetsp:Transcript_7616/g.21091  ORF Transcript_7616/g.21091 Transcript_7616/m.21091 type:complete len:217 (-) Transcript_7616:393-1043(-)
MEGHARLVFAGVPPVRRIAMVFQEQVVHIHFPHMEDLLETLVNEHVLPPEAGPGAQLVEVVEALLRSVAPSHHCVAREDLEWPMEAHLAVVQVHACICLAVDLQDALEAMRKEDGVWIDLHCPIIVTENAVADDFLPNPHEDVSVQCRPKLAPPLALEAAVNDGGLHTIRDLERDIAVDRIRIASKEVCARLVLPLQQCLLVALRQHQHPTEQCAK